MEFCNRCNSLVVRIRAHDIGGTGYGYGISVNVLLGKTLYMIVYQFYNTNIIYPVIFNPLVLSFIGFKIICFYIQVCLVSDKSKNYILSLEIIININLVNKLASLNSYASQLFVPLQTVSQCN